MIGDGSFPRATVGDEVDVVVDFVTGTSSRLNQSVTAIARPAYGTGPQQVPGGGFRWWHLLYGDGWNAGWWSSAPCTGRVALMGYFSADFRSGRDGPLALSGRVSKIHSVEVRLDPIVSGGWREIGGTETLAAVREVPANLEPWNAPDDARAHRAVTAVLIDLDLGDPPVERASFSAGFIDTCNDLVWVMHSSDPALLRIDTRRSPPGVVEFLMPLAIEPPRGEGQRRVHATPDGCWIVGEHDIHRVVEAGESAVTVERACIGGGTSSALYRDRVYVMGSTRDYLASDRRHGMIRRPADAVPMWMYDASTHSLESVTDLSTIAAIRRAHRRPDMVTAPDGARWAVGRGAIVRVVDSTRIVTSEES